ncbi:hypothetical protein MOO44_01830 [Nicoliella spurrieriana]|uniref:Uncharacterized protein n=1 Tax=Nicoliella spurrieriana TaxID=2925830 RepID=A0A976X5P0_9LACO|nr:hypothetical protein [Nicoliella spurrieriana]UQS86941.1 hypothetical protein MOO44_01830 [Nicoliella spurrieriana]
MNPQVVELFKDYYVKNEKLMSEFEDNDDIAKLNQAMDELNQQFVDEYFVRTGDRVAPDKIADLIENTIAKEDDSDNHSKK